MEQVTEPAVTSTSIGNGARATRAPSIEAPATHSGPWCGHGRSSRSPHRPTGRDGPSPGTGRRCVDHRDRPPNGRGERRTADARRTDRGAPAHPVRYRTQAAGDARHRCRGREYDPQVLAIEPSGFEAVARALVTLGHRFAAMADEEETRLTRRLTPSRTPTRGDESWTGGRDARLPDIRWAPVGLLVRNVHASHPRTGPAPNRHSSRVTASGPSPWPMPRHRGAREADADRPEGRRRGRRPLYACTRPVSETGWAVCVSQMNVQDPSDTRASLNVGYQGQTNWSTQ